MQRHATFQIPPTFKIQSLVLSLGCTFTISNLLCIHIYNVLYIVLGLYIFFSGAILSHCITRFTYDILCDVLFEKFLACIGSLILLSLLSQSSDCIGGKIYTQARTQAKTNCAFLYTYYISLASLALHSLYILALFDCSLVLYYHTITINILCTHYVYNIHTIYTLHKYFFVFSFIYCITYTKPIYYILHNKYILFHLQKLYIF